LTNRVKGVSVVATSSGTSRHDAYPDHVLFLADLLRSRWSDDLQRLFADVDDPPRGSWIRLLSMVPPEGARPTDLAVRARITKQALGQMAEVLLREGHLERTRDERDRRAYVLRRTALGDAAVERAEKVIAQMEREWAAQVGPRRYATFRAVLRELGDPSR
jgi:DNA-binding MarR family transcriptional regulator